MVNKVILVGRLGQDVELKKTPNGSFVANFSLATTEKWTDNNGVKREPTEWHRIIAWKKLAEICGAYLKKGMQVYIEGKLQTRSWEDRDGNKKYTTEIVAREMKMLSGKERTQDAPEYSNDTGFEDDDIPF